MERGCHSKSYLKLNAWHHKQTNTYRNTKISSFPYQDESTAIMAAFQKLFGKQPVPRSRSLKPDAFIEGVDFWLQYW